jgi:integrase
VRMTFGTYPATSLARAHTLADEARAALEAGRDPRSAKQRDIDAILDQYEKLRLDKSDLRSVDAIKGAFTRHVRPEIGNIGVYDIRRSHIVDMLDNIEDESGPVMADRTLAYFRKACNWYAARDDQFVPPIVKGMAKTNSRDRARQRILADDEIRDVWAALDKVTEPACYGRFIKSLLLCATRRTEAAAMHSAEIDGDLWTIPGARYKTKLDHVIPLTPQTRALIGEKPEGFKGNAWFIFSTTDGAKAFSGFSKAKRALDAEIAELRQAEGREPMPEWRLHDLRRTARSLMSRAGVPTDYAERVLGHVIGGVRGTYDRYEYLEEKRDALAKLARLVDRIISGRPTELKLVRRQEAGANA